MAVPGDCRNTVCISKSPGAVMGKQIHSKPYESLCESAQRPLLSVILKTQTEATFPSAFFSWFGGSPYARNGSPGAWDPPLPSRLVPFRPFSRFSLLFSASLRKQERIMLSNSDLSLCHFDAL